MANGAFNISQQQRKTISFTHYPRPSHGFGERVRWRGPGETFAARREFREPGETFSTSEPPAVSFVSADRSVALRRRRNCTTFHANETQSTSKVAQCFVCSCTMSSCNFVSIFIASCNTVCRSKISTSFCDCSSASFF